MGKAKVWWGVTCKRHGKDVDNTGIKWVKVGEPRGKKDRQTRGCPFCKSSLTSE